MGLPQYAAEPEPGLQREPHAGAEQRRRSVGALGRERLAAVEAEREARVVLPPAAGALHRPRHRPFAMPGRGSTDRSRMRDPCASAPSARTPSRTPPASARTAAPRRPPWRTTWTPGSAQVVNGKFRVEALVGQGGMGKVYRAKHLTLDRPVVLKMLHRTYSTDPQVVQRFQREARAASRLNHPNSIAVLDFGAAEDGTLFMAMEYLAGPRPRADHLRGVSARRGGASSGSARRSSPRSPRPTRRASSTATSSPRT